MLSITDVRYGAGSLSGGSEVGRPPLNVKAMKVRIPEGIGERIDALAGPNRRAEFIREAVVAEVERQERERGIEPARPNAGQPSDG